MTNSGPASHLRLAADRLDREVTTEAARLTTADCPDPWDVPMLSNWLGGISTAAQVLRDEADLAESNDNQKVSSHG